ncbi:MAG: hypothetical protein GEV00_11085 [Actinophytocola sp.]|nr:hypothetical protein [Actinophytocola sp.]
MQSTVRVSRQNRDRLARIAETELNGASLDETVSVLLFEYESRRGLAVRDDYLAEGQELAEVDVEVRD